MLLVIISAVLTSYCLLLLVRRQKIIKKNQSLVVEHRQIVTCTFSMQLFALFQVALREPLDLHWLHKVEFRLSQASSAEVR